MAAFLKGRVSKLETRNRPISRIRNTVLTIDAFTRKAIGPRPKGPCMVVMDFGDQWQATLLAQQERLIAEARNETNERHTT